MAGRGPESFNTKSWVIGKVPSRAAEVYVRPVKPFYFSEIFVASLFVCVSSFFWFCFVCFSVEFCLFPVFVSYSSAFPHSSLHRIPTFLRRNMGPPPQSILQRDDARHTELNLILGNVCGGAGVTRQISMSGRNARNICSGSFPLCVDTVTLFKPPVTSSGCGWQGLGPPIYGYCPMPRSFFFFFFSRTLPTFSNFFPNFFQLPTFDSGIRFFGHWVLPPPASGSQEAMRSRCPICLQVAKDALAHECGELFCEMCWVRRLRLLLAL